MGGYAVPNEAKTLADMLKVLANENRLQLLCELIEGAKTVSALGVQVPGITQPALSQHLALLKAHGLVDSEKTGQNVTYHMADPRVAEVIALLKHHYCTREENPE